MGEAITSMGRRPAGVIATGLARWRAIRITDFERHQMVAVREDLDQEYEARNGLAATRSICISPRAKEKTLVS